MTKPVRRLELQRLHEDRSHGSEFAMPTVLLGAPIWRADLFRLGARVRRSSARTITRVSPTASRAIASGSPTPMRPTRWSGSERMLTDGLESLLDEAGAADLYGVATQRQLAEVLPLALMATRRCLEAPQLILRCSLHAAERDGRADRRGSAERVQR